MFIWTWPPIVVAIFLFCFDFGMVLVCRILFEKRFYFARWWTHRFGDSIFIPIYGFCAATIIQSNFSTLTFFHNTSWLWCVFFFGYILLFLSEGTHYFKKIYTLKHELRASQIYHAIISGIMCLWLIGVLPDIILLRSPIWAFWGAVLSIVGFGLMILADYTVVSQTPEKVFKSERHR